MVRVINRPSAATERYRRQFHWHRVFVVLPRVVRDQRTGRDMFVWLHRLERRRIELGPVQWRSIAKREAR